MTERMDRVGRAVGKAAGTYCLPRLGATDRGVIAHDNGTIEVDAATLWRLDQDGLAALIAHELGHQVLNHKTAVEKLAKDREAGLKDTTQRERAIEMAADEFAGRVIAKAGYKPDGFAAAIRRVPGCSRGSVSTNPMYSVEQRVSAFQRGYREAQTTTQPASRAVR